MKREIAQLSSERRFLIERGKRRLRSLDYSAYLLSDPETARRILAAAEDSRAGRMLAVGSVDQLRAMFANELGDEDA